MKTLSVLGTGAPVRLEQELGRGGEGAVYAVSGRTDAVAKVYFQAAPLGKAQKLTAMVESATPALVGVAAWPTNLLVDRAGAVQGFLMPRKAARRDIHELYSPKSRAGAFPAADFRFLVHTAGNIARAFGVVHANGHVIGDVNHGNVIVAADGTVTLIDCDSFQIERGPQVFTCDVGVPLFTPPELQGRPLRGVKRSANHDVFGLALLIFHLLHMGRHPFAGQYLGTGDMPIERAISELRFVYGPNARSKQMQRPPATVPLEAMGQKAAEMFVAAFTEIGVSGARPGARSWVEALERLKSSLRQCGRTGSHHYPGHLARCPWCVVEAQAPVRLFGNPIRAHAQTGRVDVAALWQAIEAVRAPAADPPLPSTAAGQKVSRRIDLWKTTRKSASVFLVGAGSIGCIAFADRGGVLAAIVAYLAAAGVWPHIPQAVKAKAEKAVSAARLEWNSALTTWSNEAACAAFDETKARLARARDESVGLPEERMKRFARLDGERIARQIEAYLDRFHIERADIRSIGQSRTAMLASYGIETAADINRERILAIPGFGPAMAAALVEWRDEHGANFRFNDAAPIEPSAIAALDSELDARREELVQTLRNGPAELIFVRENIARARTRLMPRLEQAWSNLNSAEQELDAL